MAEYIYNSLAFIYFFSQNGIKRIICKLRFSFWEKSLFISHYIHVILPENIYSVGLMYNKNNWICMAPYLGDNNLDRHINNISLNRHWKIIVDILKRYIWDNNILLDMNLEAIIRPESCQAVSLLTHIQYIPCHKIYSAFKESSPLILVTSLSLSPTRE
jgi:hypothetical protein